MFHPVGSQSPGVYWRRRLLVLASAALLIVLIVLTARAMFAGGGQPAAAGPTGASSSPTTARTSDPPASTAPPSAPSTATTTGTATTGTATTSTAPTSGRTGSGASSGASNTGTATNSTATVAACTPAQLAVKAVVGKPRYAVGDHPVLTLQVTNNGPHPCVQNVADSQILLRVYNGASRVWGSHDCEIQPGVDNRTLEVGRPAGFSIVWSGLTSQPKCAGTRQRVGAGTYTLYAALSGHEGKATQFVIS